MNIKNENEEHTKIQQENACTQNKNNRNILMCVWIGPGQYLVMQVRVRTEAPPPQLREHTDQPLQEAHSFL